MTFKTWLIIKQNPKVFFVIALVNRIRERSEGNGERDRILDYEGLRTLSWRFLAAKENKIVTSSNCQLNRDLSKLVFASLNQDLTAYVLSANRTPKYDTQVRTYCATLRRRAFTAENWLFLLPCYDNLHLCPYGGPSSTNPPRDLSAVPKHLAQIANKSYNRANGRQIPGSRA